MNVRMVIECNGNYPLIGIDDMNDYTHSHQIFGYDINTQMREEKKSNDTNTNELLTQKILFSNQKQ